jgi:mRNA-degrading endonuclease RelE of RelBE toxin-antitoxin system
MTSASRLSACQGISIRVSNGSSRRSPASHVPRRLRGKAERYKIALGLYRIVYRIRHHVLLILVLKVGKKHGPAFYADIEENL